MPRQNGAVVRGLHGPDNHQPERPGRGPLVPLDNAHRSGGWAWSGERKREYANNLTDPDHLTAVTSGANRSKRAKGPERRRPPGGPSWCRYATGWTKIKATWSLTVTQPELTVLREIPGTCPSPPQVEVMQKEDKGPVQETAGQPAEAGQTAALRLMRRSRGRRRGPDTGQQGKGQGSPGQCRRASGTATGTAWYANARNGNRPRPAGSARRFTRRDFQHRDTGRRAGPHCRKAGW